MANELIKKDLQYIWHPCSQMHDYETFPPLIIKKAYGPYLELANGKKIIDAISSWWCKNLGHGNVRLKTALLQQAEKFEHVIFANTTNETIVSLAENLTHLTPGLDKIFFASEGSSAVEIAIKLSLHSRQITGERSRRGVMALQNSYHGETLLALSLSDVKLYRKPYENILTPCDFLQNIPYVCSKSVPIWENCALHWPEIEKQLEKHAATLSAIIVEPIVQGAAGMLIYSKDFLQRLRYWATQHKVHLIVDEIMTGFWRTGMPFAYQYAKIEPDIICMGKGLTAGWLPMSAVLTTHAIYELFYADYAENKAFLHSHTFSGNALAARVSLEALKIYQEENIEAQVKNKELLLRNLMLDVAAKTQRLTNVRNIGAIVAADLILDREKQHQRIGYQVFQEAIKLGAYLRPLGNTIYWLPPLNIEEDVLFELQKITIQAINKAMKNWCNSLS